jgi:predicted DNA-binding transcriptional regulator AlpA
MLVKVRHVWDVPIAMLAIVPIARSTLLRMVTLKQFPQPIHISENRRVRRPDHRVAGAG